MAEIYKQCKTKLLFVPDGWLVEYDENIQHMFNSICH